MLINFVNLPAQTCKGLASFIAKNGCDPSRAAISSQESKYRGVVLVELENINDLTSRRTKIVQDPSWLMVGYAGTVITARSGDVFVLPKANVNMLYNEPKDQNTIYCIDNNSGKMSSWLSIPMIKLPHQQNATGLLGACYDCDLDALIVSTIAGSSQNEELGKVYAIDVKTKKYFQILDNIDIISTLTGRVNREKRLYYGLARKSEIWSIALDPFNKPIGEARMEINLDGLGPRGDDKARKIRMDQEGILKVFGTPFYYNLTAPVIRQETIYTYQYNTVSKRWVLINMR